MNILCLKLSFQICSCQHFDLLEKCVLFDVFGYIRCDTWKRGVAESGERAYDLKLWKKGLRREAENHWHCHLPDCFSCESTITRTDIRWNSNLTHKKTAIFLQISQWIMWMKDENIFITIFSQFIQCTFISSHSFDCESDTVSVLIKIPIYSNSRVYKSVFNECKCFSSHADIPHNIYANGNQLREWRNVFV